jgi:hypothetical protein
MGEDHRIVLFLQTEDLCLHISLISIIFHLPCAILRRQSHH